MDGSGAYGPVGFHPALFLLLSKSWYISPCIRNSWRNSRRYGIIYRTQTRTRQKRGLWIGPVGFHPALFLLLSKAGIYPLA